MQTNLYERLSQLSMGAAEGELHVEDDVAMAGFSYAPKATMAKQAGAMIIPDPRSPHGVSRTGRKRTAAQRLEEAPLSPRSAHVASSWKVRGVDCSPAKQVPRWRSPSPPPAGSAPLSALAIANGGVGAAASPEKAGSLLEAGGADECCSLGGQLDAAFIAGGAEEGEDDENDENDNSMVSCLSRLLAAADRRDAAEERSHRSADSSFLRGHDDDDNALGDGNLFGSHESLDYDNEDEFAARETFSQMVQNAGLAPAPLPMAFVPSLAPPPPAPPLSGPVEEAGDSIAAGAAPSSALSSIVMSKPVPPPPLMGLAASAPSAADSVAINHRWSQANYILKCTFGFSGFRGQEQRDAVDATLRRKDLLLVLPTGGGKTLCYLLPALTMLGLCVVVMPYTALINDQLQECRRLGIPAAALIGGSASKEQDEVYARLQRQAEFLRHVDRGWMERAHYTAPINVKPAPGYSSASSSSGGASRQTDRITWAEPLKFLFVTPERLCRERKLLELLSDVYEATLLTQGPAPNRCRYPGISRVCFDEAHLLVESGYEFRPDFRDLAFLRNSFPQVGISAVTATAPPLVRKDIISTLLLGLDVPLHSENISLSSSSSSSSAHPFPFPATAVLGEAGLGNKVVCVSAPFDRANLKLEVRLKRAGTEGYMNRNAAPVDGGSGPGTMARPRRTSKGPETMMGILERLNERDEEDRASGKAARDEKTKKRFNAARYPPKKGKAAAAALEDLEMKPSDKLLFSINREGMAIVIGTRSLPGKTVEEIIECIRCRMEQWNEEEIERRNHAGSGASPPSPAIIVYATSRLDAEALSIAFNHPSAGLTELWASTCFAPVSPSSSSGSASSSASSSRPRDIATFYHAKIASAEEKAARQKAWLAGSVPIMVATTAFGVGINHPNVKLVVHAGMPKNIESYAQEVGRAGRSGDGTAEAICFYSHRDSESHQRRILRDFAPLVQLPPRRATMKPPAPAVPVVTAAKAIIPDGAVLELTALPTVDEILSPAFPPLLDRETALNLSVAAFANDWKKKTAPVSEGWSLLHEMAADRKLLRPLAASLSSSSAALVPLSTKAQQQLQLVNGTAGAMNCNPYLPVKLQACNQTPTMAAYSARKGLEAALRSHMAMVTFCEANSACRRQALRDYMDHGELPAASLSCLTAKAPGCQCDNCTVLLSAAERCAVRDSEPLSSSELAKPIVSAARLDGSASSQDGLAPVSAVIPIMKASRSLSGTFSFTLPPRYRPLLLLRLPSSKPLSVSNAFGSGADAGLSAEQISFATPLDVIPGGSNGLVPPVLRLDFTYHALVLLQCFIGPHLEKASELQPPVADQQRGRSVSAGPGSRGGRGGSRGGSRARGRGGHASSARRSREPSAGSSAASSIHPAEPASTFLSQDNSWRLKTLLQDIQYSVTELVKAASAMCRASAQRYKEATASSDSAGGGAAPARLMPPEATYGPLYNAHHAYEHLLPSTLGSLVANKRQAVKATISTPALALPAAPPEVLVAPPAAAGAATSEHDALFDELSDDEAERILQEFEAEQAAKKPAQVVDVEVAFALAPVTQPSKLPFLGPPPLLKAQLWSSLIRRLVCTGVLAERLVLSGNDMVHQKIVLGPKAGEFVAKSGLFTLKATVTTDSRHRVTFPSGGDGTIPLRDTAFCHALCAMPVRAVEAGAKVKLHNADGHSAHSGGEDSDDNSDSSDDCLSGGAAAGKARGRSAGRSPRGRSAGSKSRSKARKPINPPVLVLKKKASGSPNKALTGSSLLGWVTRIPAASGNTHAEPSSAMGASNGAPSSSGADSDESSASDRDGDSSSEGSADKGEQPIPVSDDDDEAGNKREQEEEEDTMIDLCSPPASGKTAALAGLASVQKCSSDGGLRAVNKSLSVLDLLDDDDDDDAN